MSEEKRKKVKGEVSDAGSEGEDGTDLQSVSDKSIEIYKLYREKVVHEDTLINFRTSWFVTLQAFLFTSFALSLGKLSGGAAAVAPMLFSIVGLAACITTLISVFAANSAINKTTEKWTKPYKDHEGRELEKGVRDIIDPVGILPALKGAGSNQGIAFRGSISSKGLPFVIGAFWIFLMITSYQDFERNNDMQETAPEVAVENADPNG